MASKLTIPLCNGSKYECEAKSGVGAQVQDCLRSIRRPFKDVHEVELFLSLTSDNHREAFADFICILGRSFKSDSEFREFFQLNTSAQREGYIQNLKPKQSAVPPYVAPTMGVRAYA